jgi:hypothetical protein
VPEFRDADGVKWRVHRRWWSLWSLLDTIGISGNGTFGAIVFVLALPILAMWPLWLLAKFCGVPWQVVTERDDDEVSSEKVRGWRASGRRIAEITAGLRELEDDQMPESMATELDESTGTEAR